ncbi:hypothetical protein NESM_000590000 [Novymonas esmeraldas]|uniref:EF-hand domain-containing protein n=1 Tax=Novymonas esmeraldas TaxID=1808958 RepID=A0AAW0ER60_9TRYP
MSDDSYSYSGSYTGDYSYSYSYSDASESNTDGKDRKTPQRAGAVPPPQAARSAPAAATAAPVKQAGSASGDSYSYSYSYTDDDGGPYSYSYSYSDSETATAAPVVRQRGPAAPTPASRTAGAVTPSATTATAKAAVAAGAPSGSYSYSYSYSDGYSGDGSYYDESYSYTDDGTYDYDYYYSSYASSAGGGPRRRDGAGGGDSYSYSYDSGSSYYSGYTDRSDDYYYSYSSPYSYSYTGEDSYGDYPYSYDTYSSYTDSDGKHHHATNGTRRRHEGDGGDNTSSYTYSATSQSPTATTSSYGESGSAASVVSDTDTVVVRDTVILRAPATDVPRPPPAPRRCFVSPRSVEDSVWQFLQRLMALQQTYEARRTAAATAAAAVDGAAAAAAAPHSLVRRADGAPSAAVGGGDDAHGGKDTSATAKQSKKTKAKKTADAGQQKDTKEKDPEDEEDEAHDGDTGAAFIPTRGGCFSERSMRIAFGVLRLNHLERREALKNAPTPLPMEAMVDVFGTCVAARAKERVAQALLSHDRYRSGEVSLPQLGALLRRLGLGTSPIIDGHRISIDVSSEGTPELVMNVERLVQLEATPTASADVAANAREGSTTATAPASATDADARAPATATPVPPPAQWEVTPVYVLRIIRQSTARREATPVRWANNALYMGRHAIVRDVTTATLFQRLKTYIEAATYLCVLSNVYTIADAETGSVTVQYPQFIRSVLLPDPPARRGASTSAAAATQQQQQQQQPSRKLLYLENLFQSVFHPFEVLQAYEEGRPVPRYNGSWALESTLHSTNDTEEKRRRNVVPGIDADNVRLAPVPSARPAEEAQLTFILHKVRVPARPPPHARCFCLVSAVTPAKVFLPAVEVPVDHVVASTKKEGDYTWVFHSKKHPKRHAALQFAGSAADRIYVECCYETQDSATGQSGEEEQGDAAAGPGRAATTRTIWCAGYVVFSVDGAATAVLPVEAGSLLQDDGPRGSPPTTTTPATAAAAVAEEEEAKGKRKNGVLRCLAWLGKRSKKNAPVTAHHVKVEVLRSSKATPGAERLPARFIAFRRHVPIIALLRAAVEVVGKEAAYALQAFRQQAVRFIFSVAADPALLDQLSVLWSHRERHWSKAQRADADHQHRTLLACVAALYGLNNTCAGSKHNFAAALKKRKSLHMTIDPSAPMVPVRV